MEKRKVGWIIFPNFELISVINLVKLLTRVGSPPLFFASGIRRDF